MPRYDYDCLKCKHEFEQVHGMNAAAAPCPKCGSTNIKRVIRTAPAIKPAPDSGWENENGGRGRYISQLQRKPGPEGSDPEAYCRSQKEIFTKARKQGKRAERADRI